MEETFEKNKFDFNFDPWQSKWSKEEFDYINKRKFDSIIDKNLGHEGGYVNNRNDRGGETKFGITKTFLEEYKYALPGGKTIPIKDLTVDDAKMLYKAMWDRYRLGEIIDWRPAYALNDYMINSYSGGVAKRTQKILNKRNAMLVIDGIFGEKTLAAINAADTEWLVDEILKDRHRNFVGIVRKRRDQINNFKGWMNRLNKVAEAVGSGLRFSTRYK